MVLHSKEKILLYGSSNSGKTHAALQFALESVLSGHKVFIIDADDGISKIVSEMPEFHPLIEAEDAGILQIETVYGWQDTLKAIGALREFRAERGDVVIVEMVNNAWEWAQAKFSADVDHETVAEHQLDKAARGKMQYGGFEGRSEWPVIKNLYFTITTPTIQTPAHVIWTASAKPLVKDNDKPEVKDLFSSTGWKYEGYKDAHYKMDSVIYLEADRRSDARSFTVIKDRGSRSIMTDVPYKYLFDRYYTLNDLAMPWLS